MMMSTLSKQRLTEIATILVLDLILVWLVGPFPLLASPLQLWASRQTWDASDRWDTIKAFAVFFLLLAVPVIIFWGPFTHAWQQIALLGPVSFANWRLRSALMLFLVPAAALLLERAHPRTFYGRIRIALPGEEVPVPPLSPTTQSEAETHPFALTLKKTAPSRSRETPSSAKKRAEATVNMEQPSQVLFEEMLSKKRPVLPSTQRPAPPPTTKKISWDEGEGTYSDKQ